MMAGGPSVPGVGPGSAQQMMNSGNGGHLDKNLELLLDLSAIEIRDEYEEKMCRSYQTVQNIFASNRSESQAHEEFMRQMLLVQSGEEITIGLIVSMLLEPANAPKYFRDLLHINRDAFQTFNNQMDYIICVKFFRLHRHSKKQLLWLCRELLRNKTVGIEMIFYNMFRNILGGDQSEGNIALCEALLDILIELRPLYEGNVNLMSFSIFNYLRLLAEHHAPHFEGLRRKEIAYCIGLLRDRFTDFTHIGRDLMRLLQQLFSIPEFEAFWRDLMTNPKAISPSFTSVLSVFKLRTPRRYLKLRIPLELEKKLAFLTGTVRFGHHRRYQEWLQKQYFLSTESQLLRCDMIRFICCHIHPSNEALASDVFPRWALIGWILSFCNSHVLTSYARLALFYDWLFFDDRDPLNHQIMDIEPAILVMFYSLKNYPAITSGLVDFLIRMSKEFHPSIAPHVKEGIRAALIKIHECKVLSTGFGVFDSPRLDPLIQKNFIEAFPGIFEMMQTPQHVLPPSPVVMGVGGPIGWPAMNLNAIPPQPANLPIPPLSNLRGAQPPVAMFQVKNELDSSAGANFSDDEDDVPTPATTQPGPASKKLKKSNSFSNGSGKGPIDLNSIVKSASPIGGPPFTVLPPESNSVAYISSIIHNSVPLGVGGPNGNATTTTPTPTPTTINSLGCDVAFVNSNSSNHLNNNHVELLANATVSGNPAFSKEELFQQIEHLPNSEMRACLVKLCNEKNKPSRCQEMGKLSKLVLDDDTDDFEEYSASLTIILLALLEDDLSVRVYPSDFSQPSQVPSEKALEESTNGPLFSMFASLVESIEDDTTEHSSLLALLAAMGTNNSKVGYLLIYYLIVGNNMSGRMSIYRSYAREMSKELPEALLADLRCCVFDDVYMFFYLLPDIFSNLATSIASVCTELIKLIVSNMDPSMFKDILAKIISGSLKVLRKDVVMPTLTASLEWESFEQYHLWQIISAHNITVDQVIPILAKLESNVHAEALSHLMLFLKKEMPTANLIKHLFNRESKPSDNFTVPILIHWAQNHPEKLAELIGNFITTKISSPNKRNKRTMNNSNKSQVSIPANIEQILYYLDEMRKTAKDSNFLTQEYMVIVLDQLKQFCSAAQKTKYDELFVNVPDDTEQNSRGSGSTSGGSSSSSTTGGNKKAASGGANSKKNQPLSKTRSGNTINKTNDSETESESSDDDVPMTKKQANTRKKRKQPIGSDSD